MYFPLNPFALLLCLVASDQTLVVSSNSEKEKSAWLESLASGPHSPLVSTAQGTDLPDRGQAKEPFPSVQKENVKPSEAFIKSEQIPVKIPQVMSRARLSNLTCTSDLAMGGGVEAKSSDILLFDVAQFLSSSKL